MTSFIHLLALMAALFLVHFLLCRLSNPYRNQWLHIKHRAARRWALHRVDRQVLRGEL